MTVRTTIAIALSLGLAATACKKKNESGSTTQGSGSQPAGSGQPEIGRPSQGFLPVLEDPKLANQPNREQKVALGNALFFDKRLSVDGSLACYSCHQNEDGNGGHDPVAIGAGGKPQPRHSPVIWNVAFFDLQKSLYWDGRADSLENLTKAAWAGGNMGVGKEDGKIEAKAGEIVKIKGYDKLFAAAFPDGKPTDPKADQVAVALSEYMRTLVCKDTAYDKFAGGEKAAMTEQQQKGLDVFMGKGQCNICHAPPHFSTAMQAPGFFQNMGIGTQKPNEADVDVGRFKVSNKPEDWAAFKPPSLRNVAKSAPYFHDGSVATLAEAVKIMGTGGIANKAKSPLLATLTQNPLTAEEQADVVAFLAALDCPGKLDPPADAPK